MISNHNSHPPPPNGYQTAMLFEYPKLPLQIAAMFMLVITAPALLGLTWLLQGSVMGLTFLTQFTLWDLILVIIMLLVTVVIHEWVHGLAYQLLGYQVTYGLSLHLFAAYAAAFGQYQKRNHNVIVALAPLIGLSLLLIPLLAMPWPRVVLIGFTALLFNIGGAVGDIYLTWRLIRLPTTALLYDVDDHTMLIYLPLP